MKLVCLRPTMPGLDPANARSSLSRRSGSALFIAALVSSVLSASSRAHGVASQVAARVAAPSASPPSGKPANPYTEISSLFQRHCTACHNGALRAGGLVLESREALLRGGKNGPVIMPGASARSRVIGMVEGRLSPRMPPSGAGLSTSEIARLKAWIDAGALGGAPGRRAPGRSEFALDLPVIAPTAPVRGAINAVAFSRDGRWLAAGGYRAVWLLRVSVPSLSAGSGRPEGRVGTASAPTLAQGRPDVSCLTGASGPVTAVAFSPNGRLLAAAGGAPGRFGEIQLWDLSTRRRVRTLCGHRDALYGVAFSADGRTLAAAGYDRLVSLWPVAGGPPRMLKDHIDAVYAVAFSPDGRQVASAAGDRTIKIWDVASGRRVYTLSEPTAEQYTVAFSPDGRRLAAAGADRMLRVWNVTAAGGALARSAFAHEGAVLRLVFSPDGRTLWTSGEDRRVKMWEVETLTERRVLERQPDWTPGLTCSPDAKRLAVGRFDGSLTLYDVATGARLAQLLPGTKTAVSQPHGTHVSAIAHRP